MWEAAVAVVLKLLEYIVSLLTFAQAEAAPGENGSAVEARTVSYSSSTQQQDQGGVQRQGGRAFAASRHAGGRAGDRHVYENPEDSAAGTPAGSSSSPPIAGSSGADGTELQRPGPFQIGLYQAHQRQGMQRRSHHQQEEQQGQQQQQEQEQQQQQQQRRQQEQEQEQQRQQQQQRRQQEQEQEQQRQQQQQRRQQEQEQEQQLQQQQQQERQQEQEQEQEHQHHHQQQHHHHHHHHHQRQQQQEQQHAWAPDMVQQQVEGDFDVATALELKCDTDTATTFTATIMASNTLLDEKTTQLRFTDSSPVQFLLVFSRVADQIESSDLRELQVSGIANTTDRLLMCHYMQQELGPLFSAASQNTAASVQASIPYEQERRPTGETIVHLRLNDTPWFQLTHGFPNSLTQHPSR